MDFLESCRICRTHCTTSNSQYLTTSINDIEIREILTQTIPIDFYDEISEKLPQKICLGCFETFMSAYELQKIAIESNEIFRTALRNEKKQKREKSKKIEKLPEVKVEDEFIEIFDESEENSNVDWTVPEVVTKSTQVPQQGKRSRKQNLKVIADVSEPCQFEDSEGQNSTGSRRRFYECDKCGAEFKSFEEIKKHIIDVHFNAKARKKYTTDRYYDIESILNQPQKCDICDEDFKNQKSYDEHFMTVHERLIQPLNPDEVKSNLKCCKCGKDHESHRALQNHLQTHQRHFETFRCLSCDNNVYYFTDLLRHSLMHSKPDTHKCLTCNESFIFDVKFIRHVRRHVNQKEVVVKCPECDLKMSSSDYFKNHYRVKHKNEQLFICPHCGKSCSTSAYLDVHIRYLHSTNAKKFKCDVCPMKFARRTQLVSHNMIHSTERPFVCDSCGFAFKEIQALRSHLKRHAGTLPHRFKCSYCGKACLTNHAKQIHERTHTGLKPEQCPYCDRCYGHKGDLTKHLRLKHLGDLIYKCDKCPKAFRTVVELREHLGTHKGGASVGEDN